MASPAFQSPSKKVTEGYFKVPNSFVENQHLLKLPASRALALIIFRAESEPNGIRTLSDRRWEAWTGFKYRQKEYAVRELRDYGLNVDGRGDTAKFSWDWNRWNQALKTQQRTSYDPKRKEREERANANREMHPDCRQNGCQMLCEGKTNKETTPFLVTAIAQPVAQTPEQATEKAWLATMIALRSFFPMIAVLFLTRLLTAVRALFPDVTDSELAQAVQVAFVPGRQKYEGLFLSRVPEALQMLRQKEKQRIALAVARSGPPLKTDKRLIEDCRKIEADPSESEAMRALARELLQSS